MICRGLNDLNTQQRIGLNRLVSELLTIDKLIYPDFVSFYRYEDLQLRIPREEIQEIELIVLSHLKKIDSGLLSYLFFFFFPLLLEYFQFFSWYV